ncbi:deoxyguanosinetriphosphate triphosphohydrolase [Funiculus sociatus GB2-M2]|nr:deoxyguanosinetriphosphate triphosphohydrolase [Trichocoleus sp. FACHB-90]
MMEWKQLLIPHRLGKDSPDKLHLEDDARTPFQRDYDRLVFSSPFRRLKDKTQVFSLAKNDYVRTRLIHSIEVSCVGRSLGTIAGGKIVKEYNLTEVSPSDFGDIVSAACLAHDVGNPPFGHSGEDALSTAFQSWYSTVNHVGETLLTDKQKADFDQFEGNAQGFRILTCLEMPPTYGGMQLTCPTLAAFTKYPRESLIAKDILNGYKGISVKKYGFFQSELELFTKVADTVGLIRRNNKSAWWARHPLAFLVEAADDICYSIVDVEDGHRMGYIPFDKASDLLNEIAEIDLNKNDESKEEKIKRLRAKAINNLVCEVAEIFFEHREKLLGGEFDEELLSKSKHHEAIKALKEEARRQVFDHPDVVGIQIAGYEVLHKLFAEFISATLHSSKKGNLIKQMLPEKHHIAENASCYEKILNITDYISGMTDSFATTLFQQFNGISI